MHEKDVFAVPELPSWGARIGIILGFFAAGLLVYGSSLTNDFVRLDDGLLIFENQAVQHVNFTTLKTIFTTYDPELYIPLTFLTYQLDYQIGHITATIYHVQNLFWHTLNALLIAWLAYLLSRRRWIAVVAGLLFALHPLNTEAVSWAAGRKDVLSTFFFFASCIGYLYYRSDNSRKWYVISIILFILGLLAKVMVLTLPVVLLLIDDFQSRPWSRKMLADKIPFFGLSVVFGIIALFGKRQLLSAVSPFEAVLLGIRSSMFYIQQLVWPAHYSISYPYEDAIRLTTPNIALSLLAVILVLGVAVWLRRRTRLYFFAVGFYIITVAPTFTNLIKGEPTLASDRYAYLPSFGLIFLAAMLLDAWIRKQPRKRKETLAWAVPLGCLSLLAILSHWQSLTWKSTETLFRHVISIYPHSYTAHNNLGNAYRRQNLLPQAETELKAAVAIKPMAKILSNLGAVYTKQGRYEEAHKIFEQAIANEPDKPDSYFGLGILLAAEGKDDEALKAYADAVRIRSNYALAYVNSAVIWEKRGNMPRAQEELRKAIEAEPALMQAYYNLAVLYEQTGDREKARDTYRQAINLQPWFIPARLNLGLLLYTLNDEAGAEKQFRAILELEPSNAEAAEAMRQMKERAGS
ncbi:MAG: hypothetical protein JWM56_886 [Candidatus Peribacteria bacterium]|nr:hypothetical protein [Candidatus Peribacteria bacterium]